MSFSKEITDPKEGYDVGIFETIFGHRHSIKKHSTRDGTITKGGLTYPVIIDVCSTCGDDVGFGEYAGARSLELEEYQKKTSKIECPNCGCPPSYSTTTYRQEDNMHERTCRCGWSIEYMPSHSYEKMLREGGK